LSTFFDFSKVRAWAIEAGQIALNYYQTQLTKEQKADYGPVTAADKAVEQFLIDKIGQTYSPAQYGLIAEESGGAWQHKKFVWAIDPIDGTRVFLNGIPLWCISIGLLKDGRPYRGVVYMPVTQDIYYTDNNGAAYWNNRPLQNMLPTTWDRDSFIGVPSKVHRYFEIDFGRLRALGAIATHHVFVASGIAVAALHRQVGVWDIAGAHAILQAAGGQAVYLDGTPFELAQLLTEGTKICRTPILAGHPAIIEKLLPRIKPL